METKGKLQIAIGVSAGLFILVGLSLPTSKLMEILQGSDSVTLRMSTLFISILFASGAFFVAVLLLYLAQNLYDDWQKVKAEDGHLQAAREYAASIVIVLLLSAGLTANALHSVYWSLVLDGTINGFEYFWLFFPLLAVFLSGLILNAILNKRSRLFRLSYFLLIPLLIGISTIAQRADYHKITADRAERVSSAIESYYTQQGHYPQTLNQLFPRYTLAIPEPIIIIGLEWCYDSSADAYRLGYLDREHWSAPYLIGRIYSSEGELDGLGPICEGQAELFQARHPGFYTYWEESE